MALGDVRQPDRRPAGSRRDLPVDQRRSTAGAARELRRSRSAARHRRDAAVGLHPGEGARSGLELGTHDRRVRRGVRATDRVPDQRAARQEPPPAPLDPTHQGARRRRCHPARRLRRVPGGVLLPDAVHAERARLLADSDRRRVPAGHRWRRHCRRSHIAAVVAHRNATVDRCRLADRRRRRVLPLAHPGGRLLRHGSAAGTGGHVDRHRRRVRRGDDGRERRRAEDKAGLAAALLNASQQVGGALGLAIFSAIATSRTTDLLAAHASPADALTSGFHRALLASSLFLAAAAVVATRITNTRGEQDRAKDESQGRIEPAPGPSEGSGEPGALPQGARA